MLSIEELTEGEVYRIHSRNLVVGVWRAASKGFIGIRVKFGDHYLFEEYHHETGMPYGTVRPIVSLGVRVPDGIPIETGHTEPDPLNPDRKIFAQNRALFDFLKPYDEEIDRIIAEEREQERLERESKRWAPMTLAEHEEAERLAEVKEWVKEQRAAGRMYRDFMPEYHERLKQARNGDA